MLIFYLKRKKIKIIFKKYFTKKKIFIQYGKYNLIFVILKNNFWKIFLQKLVWLINVISIILMVVLAIIWIFRKDLFEDFIKWLEIVISGLWDWNYLIVFSSSFIEAFPVIWVVVPGQNILMVVWWFFAKISQTNLIFVWIFASLWAIIWNYVWFYLWRKYWDSFFEKYWNRFGIWLTEVKYLKKWITKWWPLGITFWKFHPLTRAFLPFIAGSMGMKSTSFMIYNIIGSIIWALTIVILGLVFVEYYKIILDYIGYIMLGIFVCIWVYIYKYKKEEFKKYRIEKGEEMERLYGIKK